MKLNKEKILLLIIAVLLIIAIVFAIMFSINKKNENKYEDDYEQVSEIITNNIYFYTLGYNTNYLGQEKIFEKKKFTVDDLKEVNILTSISQYLVSNEIEYDFEIDTDFAEKYDLSDTTEFYIMSKEQVDEYAKKLFNITDFDYKDYSEDDFIYEYRYDSDKEVYILTPSDSYDADSMTDINHIYPSVISSKSTSNSVITTIVVAYTKNDDEKITYYKDADMTKEVFSINTSDLTKTNDDGTLELNDDIDKLENHTDEFTKYEITYKNNDGNYTFSKIVKK